MNKVRLTLFFLPFLLVACQTQQPVGEVEGSEGGVAEPDIRPASDLPDVIPGAQTERERLIADTLFEGLQALDGDRLLTPLDDNAHARFQRALAMDPGNEIALDGLDRIVVRYVDLAAEASRRGLFTNAEALLENARFINDKHPALLEAWIALEAERTSEDLFFNLDNAEFSRRTQGAQMQLADIAARAKEHDAFVLITAPNDETARWMFLEMRGALEGYRLRGNIELAGQTGIRLRLPED
ncbi:MAG: hypothetical protein GKR91_05780 [Pseudomonadales bacterium]|nr:hypothetical protein [Pseudomonadales bacterium]